jgi:hypothetical protein
MQSESNPGKSPMPGALDHRLGSDPSNPECPGRADPVQGPSPDPAPNRKSSDRAIQAQSQAEQDTAPEAASGRSEITIPRPARKAQHPERRRCRGRCRSAARSVVGDSAGRPTEASPAAGATPGVRRSEDPAGRRSARSPNGLRERSSVGLIAHWLHRRSNAHTVGSS